MKLTDPHINVISSGPPDRSLAEIMRDPPVLKMSKPLDKTNLIDELEKAASKYDQEAEDFRKASEWAFGSNRANKYAEEVDNASNFATRLRDRIKAIKDTIELYEKLNKLSPDSLITDLVRNLINQLTGNIG